MTSARLRGAVALLLLLISSAVALSSPAGLAARLLARSWRARVAIEGRSMEPALEHGDWLLVDPDGYRARSPRPGDLVLAPDPREPERVLIKRVATVTADGRLTIRGDAPDASTDSRVFGSIAVGDVRGRPWFRYSPLERIGPLR